MNSRYYCFLFIGLVLLSLMGCGFHLRGYGEAPMLPFNAIYINSALPYSDFTQTLRQTLASYGVKTQQPSVPLTLDILSENFRRTITNLGKAGQTMTYLLSYSILFQVKDNQHHILLPAQQILVTRNFSITSNQLSGDLNVQNNLQNTMKYDVINQLITRLAFSMRYHQFC